jgi:DNA-binding transcriptional MocR family regulator
MRDFEDDMSKIAELPTEQLQALHARVKGEYDEFRARGLKLDMTRGKPAPEQLDLANGLLALPGNGDYFSETHEDGRNYGNNQGLSEARAMVSTLMGATPDRIIIGENASLAMMHDSIVWALLKGVPGSTKSWSKEEQITFLCPVPGYDRHFGICEEYGIRMVPVPLTGHGPDMEVVEKLAADPSVKGMWCVPKYANPTGEVYSAETVRRLAAMKTGAPDFRLFWDNAYAVHHLTDNDNALVNILDACAEAGNADRAFVFASTSKITFAGAGLAFFASSDANVKWYLARSSKRTIGPDKLNQIRHVRFLKDDAGINGHMQKHRALLAPKFDAVLDALEAKLGGTGVAEWTRPEGGYFISVDGLAGTAAKVVTLAKDAGLALTPAGATWPLRNDPKDRTLRLAPSYPSLDEVRTAAQGIAICLLLAGVEKLLAERG